MKAAPIFFAFFILFTVASIAVPIPLFPGNLIAPLFQLPLSDYLLYVQALTNGLTYGLVTLFVFFVINKKLEKSLTTDSKRITR